MAKRAVSGRPIGRPMLRPYPDDSVSKRRLLITERASRRVSRLSFLTIHSVALRDSWVRSTGGGPSSQAPQSVAAQSASPSSASPRRVLLRRVLLRRVLLQRRLLDRGVAAFELEGSVHLNEARGGAGRRRLRGGAGRRCMRGLDEADRLLLRCRRARADLGRRVVGGLAYRRRRDPPKSVDQLDPVMRESWPSTRSSS